MKTYRIILYFLFVIITENCFAQSHEYEDYDPSHPSLSKFPGGYEALAIQRGKSSGGIKFWAFQISAGVALLHNMDKNLITPFEMG